MYGGGIMLNFTLGLLCGGTVGVVVMALCNVASLADEYNGYN
jgi:hypothetical protein